MTPARRSRDHNVPDTMRIRMLVNAIENHAYARYAADPENITVIGGVLKQALKALRQPGDPPGFTYKGICPDGWYHERDCSCWPDEFGLVGTRRKGDPDDVRELQDDLERLYEGMDSIRRRLGDLGGRG